ncbi:MAG: hypothetical protein JO061_14430 [Acidobacteriaceae bacterium]|nr:hypothetical protein [Acidobacteriaceae bacterium]
MSIAYGMTLNFSKEQVSRDGTVVADFTRIHGGAWLYGCNSDQQFCKTPTLTRRPGITIYHAAEIEFRTYCLDGGYVGQGEGDRFLISLKDTWIQFYGTGSPSQLMDRIVASLASTN